MMGFWCALRLSLIHISVGGLVARRETRIVMAKEVLRISIKKIVVDYDFRNDSDQNVITEVAFPVPPYGSSMDYPPAEIASFSDFKLSIDRKPASFKVEAKAMFKGKDVTEILVKDRLDVASFGNSEDGVTYCRNFVSLPAVSYTHLDVYKRQDTRVGYWRLIRTRRPAVL